MNDTATSKRQLSGHLCSDLAEYVNKRISETSKEAHDAGFTLTALYDEPDDVKTTEAFAERLVTAMKAHLHARARLMCWLHHAARMNDTTIRAALDTAHHVGGGEGVQVIVMELAMFSNGYNRETSDELNKLTDEIAAKYGCTMTPEQDKEAEERLARIGVL